MKNTIYCTVEELINRGNRLFGENVLTEEERK